MCWAVCVVFVVEERSWDFGWICSLGWRFEECFVFCFVPLSFYRTIDRFSISKRLTCALVKVSSCEGTTSAMHEESFLLYGSSST